MPDYPVLNRSFNQVRTYPEIIQDPPNGLATAILTVLRLHLGTTFAIGREELVLAVEKLGYPCHERMVREMIKWLRREGHLICSKPGEDGGYYMARDKAEYLDFKNHEFIPKICDMQETVTAMDKAADKQFGPALQLSLIR